MNAVAEPAIERDRCVIRETHKTKGRTLWLAPDRASVRHLHYGRIVLEAGDPVLEFATGSRETGLLCLRGHAAVETAGKRFEVTPYDAVYAPRGSAVRVEPGSGGCDFAEISAPVS